MEVWRAIRPRSFKCDEKGKENWRGDGQGKGKEAPGEKNLRCKGSCSGLTRLALAVIKDQFPWPMGYIHGRHLALRAGLVGPAVV